MDNKDEKLWYIAKKRVKFKRHLAAYIIVNGFLWILWFFTLNHEDARDHMGLPWPAWSCLGWGIGLAFSYYGAYMSNGTDDVQKEYEKLKNKEKQ
jgi:hypothetical protein